MNNWLTNSKLRPSVLFYLSQQPSTASDIAKKLNVHPRTVKTILDQFVEKNYSIKSQSEEDHRKIIHTVTSAGQDALKTAQEQDLIPIIAQDNFITTIKLKIVELTTVITKLTTERTILEETVSKLQQE